MLLVHSKAVHALDCYYLAVQLEEERRIKLEQKVVGLSVGLAVLAVLFVGLVVVLVVVLVAKWYVKLIASHVEEIILALKKKRDCDLLTAHNY